MARRTIFISTGVIAAALVAGGTAVIATGAIDDGEEPITGDALVKASEVALAHTGGGRVTGTEVGDEDSYYEVEVTLDDGRQVDVQLDRDFQVVGAADDVEDDEGDEGDAGED